MARWPFEDRLYAGRRNFDFKKAKLIARDGLYCHWCGMLCDSNLKSSANNYPTKDHLIRRADGGSNRLENLVVACRKCNNERHALGWKPRKQHETI